MASPRNHADPAEGEDRRNQVRTIFTEIAPRYDLLNHVLSLNVDRRWRRRAVHRLREGLVAHADASSRCCGKLRPRAKDADSGSASGSDSAPGPRLLDCCAGTCDLSLDLLRIGAGVRVVSADFALPMLVAGVRKTADRPVLLTCADALELPFPDDSFSGAAIAFGLRNLADVGAGLRELRRVLRPSGRLVILEFTTPPNPAVRAGYHFYFKRVLPLVGRVVSGHPWAYTYLPRSVGAFPGPEPLADELRMAGYGDVDYELLSAGIAALHWGSA